MDIVQAAAMFSNNVPDGGGGGGIRRGAPEHVPGRQKFGKGKKSNCSGETP